MMRLIKSGERANQQFEILLLMQSPRRCDGAPALAGEPRGNPAGIQRIVQNDAALANRLWKIIRRILCLKDEPLGKRID
ncbi:hypothetical protein SDC9_195785 [bioreactor metagenome]|uniref:Uncharacterized protein n=1 Tax=bioreactor metagenome TaxID=1076179 RepID=A0A645IAN2_9ZZZZ